MNTTYSHRHIFYFDLRGGASGSIGLWTAAGGGLVLLARRMEPGLGYGLIWYSGPVAVVSTPVLASLILPKPVAQVPLKTCKWEEWCNGASLKHVFWIKLSVALDIKQEIRPCKAYWASFVFLAPNSVPANCTSHISGHYCKQLKTSQAYYLCWPLWPWHDVFWLLRASCKIPYKLSVKQTLSPKEHSYIGLVMGKCTEFIIQGIFPKVGTSGPIMNFWIFEF